MKEKIADLYSENNNKAYKVLLELESITTESNELYNYFDELLKMLDNDKTYVKTRGFRLICALAKWDTESKIDKNIAKILNTLDDGVGVSVRQCLQALHLILMYKIELNDKIEVKLKNLDLSKYKDTLKPLAQKDIDEILEYL
ncbi:SufBD protein [Candidatus Dojkabacteria bacterium]|uniref:SufBD protein n=1 Tax=Candidatus Dojkabacteria bacterium TaxID=2099670 RepID=A0A847VEC5_9BACT|nr:SufBD protein [Candidatus Dojkabacteria bacterium]